MIEDEPSPAICKWFCCSTNDTHSLPDAEPLNSRASSIGAADADKLRPFWRLGSRVALNELTRTKSRTSKLTENPFGTLNGVDMNGSLRSSVLITF